ncbi:MAG: HEPN domain-containing protein [Treponema sp.]|nr:HEPN domain-containing protein [Treponema sp.]
MDEYKAEILQQWLDKASDDLRAAEYLSTMRHPMPDEIICFHCQQSAEKYLKAFIFLQDIEPEKSHILEDLLTICQKYNAEFSTLLSKAILLTRYGVMPRYPNDLGITNEQMKTAIQYAKDVQEFVLQVIKNEQEADTNEQ